MRAWTIVVACWIVAVFACQSIPDIQFYPDSDAGSSGGPASGTSGGGGTTSSSTTSSGGTSSGSSGTSGTTSSGDVPDAATVECPANPPAPGVCCDTRPCYRCTADMCTKCADCAGGTVCCRQGGSTKVFCAAAAQGCP